MSKEQETTENQTTLGKYKVAFEDEQAHEGRQGNINTLYLSDLTGATAGIVEIKTGSSELNKRIVKAIKQAIK